MSIIGTAYKRFIITKIKNTEDNPDVNEWYDYLNSLPRATDVYSKSYNKYLCRKWYLSRALSVALNIAALPTFIYSLVKALKANSALPNPRPGALVVLEVPNLGFDDIFPDELKNRFNEIIVDTLPKLSTCHMCKEAKDIYFNCIKQHPFSWYYLVYVYKELAYHSSILEKHSPSGTAVYVNERNIALPLLRLLYENSGRELDSFMHGEYLLQLIQGYMSFSNYYIWDDSYKDMFCDELKCDCGNYITYTPLKLQKKWNLEKIKPSHYCTYYFSGESEDSIRQVSKILAELESAGHICLVRPHPRYSHTDLIKSCFRADQIEDPKQISIEQSLGATEYAIGLSSTVLFEAESEGRTPVIDDLSNPNAYNNLKNRHFRLLQKDALLLSDLINRR